MELVYSALAVGVVLGFALGLLYTRQRLEEALSYLDRALMVRKINEVWFGYSVNLIKFLEDEMSVKKEKKTDETTDVRS